MIGTRSCDSCQIHSAAVFCECTGDRTYLCGRCLGDHTTVKYRHLMHQFIPADIEIADVTAYKQRSEAFATGSAELKRNLTRIDLCCQEVAEAYNGLIERLGQWRDYYVSELKAWKVTLSAEIAEAENEVKSSLVQEEVELKGKYSPFLRYYQPGTLQLFTYQIDWSSFENWVQSVVKFQYAEMPDADSFARPFGLKQNLQRDSYHPEACDVLVRLRNHRIELFDFESETFGPSVRLAKPINFDWFSRYTLVDEKRVFSCGNVSREKAAYLVHAGSGAVEDLPPLEFGRACPGLLSHQDSVFVFGTGSERYTGPEGPGKEAEMLLLPQVWMRLPDMTTGRVCFTPCVYGPNAYLCTAEDAIIDVFDLQTLKLAKTISKSPEKHISAVCVVVEHEMIVISKKYTTAIDLRNSAVRRQPHSFSQICPASIPVVYQHCIYWVCNSGGCWKASGSDFEVVESIARLR